VLGLRVVVEPGRLREGYCGCLGKLGGKENGN
jgi:hypothetical protein